MSRLRLLRGTLIDGENQAAIDAVQATRLKLEGLQTLRMTLQEIDAVDDKAVYKDFSDFLKVCRVKEIHQINREMQEEKAKLEQKLSTETDKKKIKKLEKAIEELRPFDTPITEEDCDKVIEQNKERFGAAQKKVVRLAKVVLAMLNDSGVISDTRFQTLLKRGKNYVPLFRVSDENEDFSTGDSLRKMIGSSRDVIDPIESLINTTHDLIKRAETNKARCLLANLVRAGGMGDLFDFGEGQNLQDVEPIEGETLEEVAKNTPDDETTIPFFENGVKKISCDRPASG